MARTSSSDTLRVSLLGALCWNLSRSNLPQARRYAEQGITLARRLHYPAGEALCINNLGTCLALAGSADEALSKHMAALRIFQSLNDHKSMAHAYNGIANCHNLHQNFSTAATFYQKALHLAEKRHDAADQALFLSNLADLASKQNQPAHANTYIRRALRLYTSLDNLPGQANSLFTLGTVQSQQQLPDSAQENLLDALLLYRVLGDEYGLSGAYTTLSEVMVAQKSLLPGLEAAQLGMRYAKHVGSSERTQNAYQQLAATYAMLGEYKQAYAMQQRFQQLRDSLVTDVNTRAMAALQSRFNTQDQENRIRLLTHRQNVTQLHADRDADRVRLLAVAVGGLLLLIVVGGVLYGQLLRGRKELAAQHQLVADKNVALESAAQQLHQLADSKARLYAIIAHDLRGPVMAFTGVTELIQFYQRTNDQEGLRHLPELVRESAQSLNGLLDNLLNWAVSETGELSCHPERVSVRELLSECYELFQTTAHSNQISLQYEAPSHLALYADPNMVRTILRNLVSNALKFTPNGGTIRLQATPDTTDPTQICISVTDTGPGMPVDKLKQVLQPEAGQLRATDSGRPTQGTGLGLQLCRTFAECHGGTLGMGAGPEGGAMVWVTLPAAGQSIMVATPPNAGFQSPSAA
ncbi:tetratricopeptide repeat-containing sensor histidine kinase [Hymenobacter sp. BT186]|uniref:histidine kinase n=1 Tax=Hymenobacter telluris TaxID=2816474 RepID=A0A939JB89_9BACT|nr:ATP-binding protein [Hymenobacter telluris]MBO0356548.1 tetratricopeptide repeat-containing sensor histidine kinase [Hymenobacter telluris]MBW3372573.1 tetratricopeptide repeat-containing sensor histidine kinase [Hymenobacter norwichensis]